MLLLITQVQIILSCTAPIYLPSSDCSEIGFRYKGTNVDFKRNVLSAAECQAFCQSVPTCVFFVYSTADRSTQPNTCSLKDGAATRAATADVISGPRNC